MSLLKDLADALAQGLAAHEWESVDAQPSVERVNWPTYAIDDMATPVIAVVPRLSGTIQRVDRTQHQYDYEITVFIGRHTSTDAEADEMLAMAEEAVDLIVAHSWGEIQFPATSPMMVDIQVNPDDAVHERNVWRAIITVTYRTFR